MNFMSVLSQIRLMSFLIKKKSSSAARNLSVIVATIVKIMFDNRFHAFAFYDLVTVKSEFILLEY